MIVWGGEGGLGFLLWMRVVRFVYGGQVRYIHTHTQTERETERVHYCYYYYYKQKADDDNSPRMGIYGDEHRDRHDDRTTGTPQHSTSKTSYSPLSASPSLLDN